MLSKFFASLTTKKAIVIICIVGFVVYFNGLFGEFIGDDIPQIVSNPFVHTLNYVWSFFVNPPSLGLLFQRFYRPVMFTSFAGLYSLFGTNVIFYHLFQLCLYISNTILLFLLFKRFFDRKLSFFLSLIFLLHPINTEIVNYASALQEALFFLFGLLSIFALNFKNIDVHKKFFIISVFIFLALLSKETAILFIPIIILFSYLYENGELKQSIIASVTSLSIYAFLRLFIAKVYLVSSSAPTPLLLKTTLLTAPKMIYFYLSMFIFPKDLAIRHTWLVYFPSLTDFYIPLAVDILFLIFIISIGFFIFKIKRADLSKYIFFLVWFVLGMVPTLQLWGLDATVAERWFYFPMVGLLGIFGVLFANSIIKNNKIKTLLIAVGFIALIGLGVRTIFRNIDWQSRINLYEHDFSLSKDILTGNSLEQEYIFTGKFDEAKNLLTVLIKLNPDDPVNNSYKAVIAMHDGDLVSAEKDLRSLFSTKYSGLAYQALPKILFDRGNYKEAEELLLQGVKLYPNDPVLWRNLAYVEYKMGNLKQASEAAQKINLTIQQIIGP